MKQPADLLFSILSVGNVCDCPGADDSVPVLQACDTSAGVGGTWIRRFHWTGEQWQACEYQPMRPGSVLRSGEQPDEQEQSVTDRLSSWANSVPLEHWKRELRREARDHVWAWRGTLDDERAAVRYARNRLRQARCLAVVAELAGSAEGLVALRLVSQGWPGTAAELRATVRTLAAPSA